MVGLALTSGACVESAAQTVLKAAPLGPAEHLLTTQILAPWAASVERATEGRVKIEILPQAVSPPTAIFETVSSGKIDISILSNGASARSLPLNGFIGNAGLTPSAVLASKAYQDAVSQRPELMKEYDGVKLLGVFVHGPGAILTNGARLTQSSEFKDVRLHAGGASAAVAAKALGAQPELKPGPAAHALLSAGEVVGTITPPQSYDGFRLKGLVKAAVMVPGGFYNAGFSLLMNQDRWAALTPKDQQAILSVSGVALAELAGKAWDAGDEQALKAMKADGVEIIMIDPKTLSPPGTKGLAERVEEAWVATLGPQGAAGSAILADFRGKLGNPGIQGRPK